MNTKNMYAKGGSAYGGKRKTKKQPNKNKKVKVSSKTRAKSSAAPKKKAAEKKIAKQTSKAKVRKSSKSKTKASFKKISKAVLRQKAKKNKLRSSISKRKQSGSILTFGNLEPQSGKILLLIIAIIIAVTVLVVQNKKIVEDAKPQQPQVAGVETTRKIDREKEINDLVRGYPIEKMTRYIVKEDPKVAAFLIAIAKKESAWGERKPVLNGEDCYNYWGFRLKSDRMGSGGHTCFDFPEEAVEIVGTRLRRLVNEEKIDTPREMVIWKCGYDCDGPEAAGSEKWIKDVDYYYRQLIN